MPDDPSPVVSRPDGPLAWPTEPLTDGVILLDEPTPDDAGGVVASIDAEAARWLPLPFPYTQRDAEEWLALVEEARQSGDGLHFAVREPRDGSYLGSIGVHFGRCRAGEAEMGYLVAPPARLRGVARRAMRLVVPWIFTTYGPRRIEVLVRPENAASRRAAEAAGAAFEGVRAAGIGFRDGRVADAAVYAFTPPADYPSPP